MHFIIMADGFSAPRSFRTEAYGLTHVDAQGMAHGYLMQQPINITNWELMSSERVPD
jgi:hypothetical protein